MAIQAKIEFYVRISDVRQPELFDWLRKVGKSTGMTPQEIAILCMKEKMKEGPAIERNLYPSDSSGTAQPRAPATVETPAVPRAEPVDRRSDLPAPPIPERSLSGVPVAPFGGVMDSLIDRGN